MRPVVAHRSRASALDIIQQSANRAGYAVPEDASDEALHTFLTNPVGLRAPREWFDANVGGPVLTRLTLARVLEIMDGAHPESNPVENIDRALEVQRTLTDQPVEGSLVVPTIAVTDRYIQ